jgi:hypothetical protein
MLTVNMNPPEKSYMGPVSIAFFRKNGKFTAGLEERDSSY